jgi:pre-mRNA-splicing factor CWC22
MNSVPRRRRDDSLSRSPTPASRRNVRNVRRNTSSASGSPPARRRGQHNSPPPRRARRGGSYERSPEPRRGTSIEVVRDRDRARRGRDDSVSASPPAKRRRNYSDSRSPPPKRGRRYS